MRNSGYNSLMVGSWCLRVISQIEQALVERLSAGLGKLATVSPYAGELDDQNLGVRRLPLVLVSYGGGRFEVKSNSAYGNRFEAQETFVVILITRSLRSAVTGVRGGVTDREIGVNQLLQAVKYLLVNQTLNQRVLPIKPLQIQTLWNNAEVKRERLSAYAIEFEARYNQPTLADGAFPIGSEDKGEIEWLFSHYQGELSPPDTDLMGVNGVIVDPNTTAQVGINIDLKDKK